MAAEIGGREPTARRPAGEVKGAKTLYPTIDYVPNDVKKDDAKKPEKKLRTHWKIRMNKCVALTSARKYGRTP